MFAWLTGLFKKETIKSTEWVKKLMQANRSGSYSKYKEYYDKHVFRIHNSYHKDFLRFERFATQSYKKNDQRAFMAIKTAMYAQKLGQVKVAACLTASVINLNKTLVETRQVQLHPRLQRAALALHKQIVESHSKSKKRKMEKA
ncbi:hypothetical protein A1OO_13880 [Enterovibrio norvegicus FF-33]|uniref:Uncharacterized protein n=1 Tax=Enterovibrio norvegicus FF-454 TaxID=1185651 RepID=A0A1E5CBX3_9GAMM|nr:hypothetical protein [Enterovibrio norvegicus]OEE62927.1 hypothetical protein A1OK_20300 [Enterovibrio norvegicus FF-454]OEE66851.1 hypothetical protein A1OO_13880 [Enterovibrio norvegicus FF-33]OEE75015.1 hypothetical protein A1OQ_07730 [Enterovibrio norvegicus FF-162]